MSPKDLQEELEKEIERKAEYGSRELIEEIFEEMEELVGPKPKGKEEEVATKGNVESSEERVSGGETVDLVSFAEKVSGSGESSSGEDFSRLANEVVEEVYRTTMELVNRKLARYVLRKVLERLE